MRPTLDGTRADGNASKKRRTLGVTKVNAVSQIERMIKFEEGRTNEAEARAEEDEDEDEDEDAEQDDDKPDAIDEDDKWQERLVELVAMAQAGARKALHQAIQRSQTTTTTPNNTSTTEKTMTLMMLTRMRTHTNKPWLRTY